MGYCVGCVLMAILEVPDERGSVMSYDAMEPTWQDKYNAVSDARYSLCEGYAVSDRVAVRDVFNRQFFVLAIDLLTPEQVDSLIDLTVSATTYTYTADGWGL